MLALFLSGLQTSSLPWSASVPLSLSLWVPALTPPHPVALINLVAPGMLLATAAPVLEATLHQPHALVVPLVVGAATG